MSSPHQPHLAELLTLGGFSTQVPQIPGALCPAHSIVHSPEFTVAAAAGAAHLTFYIVHSSLSVIGLPGAFFLVT